MHLKCSSLREKEEQAFKNDFSVFLTKESISGFAGAIPQ
jgi:hypothetical protein